MIQNNFNIFKICLVFWLSNVSTENATSYKYEQMEEEYVGIFQKLLEILS